MLSQKSNGILGIIWISSRHVHVINEVKHLILSNWGKVNTSFLLKELFKDHLKQVSISVEIEIDDLLNVFVTSTYKFVEETFNDLSLTTTSKTN
jgi:hypothetical protein